MPFKKTVALAAILAVFAGVSTEASAQHEGMPGMKDTAKKKSPAAKPKPKKGPPRPKTDSMASPMKMSATTRVHLGHNMMSGPLSIPMDRMGSGTTWIPDAVSLPSRSRMFGQWELMAHGFVFAQYNKQTGPRGGNQIGSLNWGMLMASHELAGGHFQARTMLSFDPATVTPKGYPLLLQTGEAYHGQPLHDRQHPHDFFMELGVLYQREFNRNLGWSIYAAPSGEPALGPVAFMHRPSAMDNPNAPLGHHWQDATHVSFGVITGGILNKRWQLEASAFNGREPDEHRWNFDPISIDSYSARITVNPSANWSFTAGMGYLESPEALHPDESMHRFTASILHGRKFDSGQSASAVIWGANRPSSSATTQSVLVENETIFDTRNTFFGRAEFVQKTADDLVINNVSATRFNVAALQLGYIREVARGRWATLGLGGAATLNVVPQTLESVYGSRAPMGTFVFVRLRPFHMIKGSMSP